MAPPQPCRPDWRSLWTPMPSVRDVSWMDRQVRMAMTAMDAESAPGVTLHAANVACSASPTSLWWQHCMTVRLGTAFRLSYVLHPLKSNLAEVLQNRTDVVRNLLNNSLAAKG